MQIAEREGDGEDSLHAGGPRAPRMVGAERATPAEQVRQTALVQRVGEAAIRRPSVADQSLPCPAGLRARKLQAILRTARCQPINTLWPLLGACLSRFHGDRVPKLFPPRRLHGKHSIMKNAIVASFVGLRS